MNRKQHNHRAERNREIGLVKRESPENNKPIPSQLDIEFECLRKTIAITQNEDMEWQSERKEIAHILECIRQKRALLALLMYTNTSNEEKLDIYTFLMNQNSQSVALESETSKYYALDAHVPHIP